ncbi:hypothetical protein SWUG_00002 [Synechococcus phage S-RIM2 R9_2006]|uniref:Uncharacterized protein n=1 Tax=Synechococcus phage S-RIM2 R9_2006 TaxID=869663 RepID=M4PQC9_9CAUD|nr:hypothetical protein SWUG_00002 [Synechococcus phage S-RIM2 R9_2006]
MATVQKSTKINFYKFVATKDVSPSAKGVDEGTVATVKVLNKNTEALNNIGSVLNGIAKIAQDLKKVMLMQVDAQQRKNVTFDAQYTKTKKRKRVDLLLVL